VPGPAALPKKIHELHGNPSKKKFKDTHPDPPTKIPKIPSHLGKLAKKQWRYIAPKLADLGVISETDQTALATYCEAYEHWVNLGKQISEDAKHKIIFDLWVKEGSLGEPPIVPLAFRDNLSLHRSIIQVRDQLRKLVAEFGMTPSSRGRVIVRDFKQKGNPYEEWKEGKK